MALACRSSSPRPRTRRCHRACRKGMPCDRRRLGGRSNAQTLVVGVRPTGRRLRPSRARTRSSIRRDGVADPRRRHRRNNSDLQRRARGAAAPAALSGGRSNRHGLQLVPAVRTGGGGHLPGGVRGSARADQELRPLGGDAAADLRADRWVQRRRRMRTGTNQRVRRLSGALRSAGCAASARTSVRIGRRRDRRRSRGLDQRWAVAPPLRSPIPVSSAA